MALLLLRGRSHVRISLPAAFLVTLLLCSFDRGQEKPRYAGPTAEGYLLPNGWTVSPAGKQVTLTDLPLNIVPLADGKHVLVASSGYNPHTLALVDLASAEIVSKFTTRNSWFGLAVSPEQDKVWWSGGGADVLHTLSLKDGKLALTSKPEPAAVRDGTAKKKAPLAGEPEKQSHFRSGMALDAGTRTLYSLDINAGTIAALDAQDGSLGYKQKCGGRPYDVVRSRNGAQLFVSDWAGEHGAGRSSRASCAPSPASMSASTRIRSSCTRATTGCSSPAPRPTASASSTRCAASSPKRS